MAVISLTGCSGAHARFHTAQSASSALTAYMDPHFPGAPYYWHIVEAALEDATQNGDRSLIVVGWARMHWIDAGMYVLADTGTAIQLREWGGWTDQLDYLPTQWTIHGTVDSDSDAGRCYRELYTLIASSPSHDDATAKNGWPRVNWLWLPREGRLWRFNQAIRDPQAVSHDESDMMDDAMDRMRTAAKDSLSADWQAGAAMVQLADILADSIGIWENSESE